ncbi:MAG TPA: hypothetical protein VIY52_30275 [Streptosporangiaceae bacterium]
MSVMPTCGYADLAAGTAGGGLIADWKAGNWPHCDLGAKVRA